MEEIYIKNLSIAVLSLFTLDLLMLLVASGRLFFRHIGYVVDLVIVPTSLFLEIFLGAFGGFLVVFRLWRVLRVMKKSSEAKGQHSAQKIGRLQRGLLVVQQCFTRVSDARTTKDWMILEHEAEIEKLQHGEAGNRGNKKRLESSMSLSNMQQAQVLGEGNRKDQVEFDEDLIGEEEAARIAFSKWDLNKDGVLQENELKLIFQACQCPVSIQAMRGFYNLLDLNNSGEVELDDFTAFRRVLNGRFLGAPDFLLLPARFDDTIAELRHNVKHVMLDQNEDPDVHNANDIDDDNKNKNEDGSVEEDERPKWRVTMQETMESDKVNLAVTILLCLDIVRFFIDLTILEGLYGDEPHKPWVKDMSSVLGWMSIVILSLFSVELLLLIIALGFRFFRNAGYVVDIIVVPLSLVLELVAEGIGGFLVIVRMWRMMRVMRKMTNAKQERVFRTEKRLNNQLLTVQKNFMHAADRLEDRNFVEQRKLKQLNKLRAARGIMVPVSDDAVYTAEQDNWDKTWNLFRPKGGEIASPQVIVRVHEHPDQHSDSD